MHFIRVDAANTFLVERFVQRAGRSLTTFRYFAKRPFSVVGCHLCTWVIEERGQIEAYGHLEREGETVWLGLAVSEQAQGKGLGREMMQRLMDSAHALGLQVIRLSVDNSNQPAIKLYEKFGFRLLDRRETFGIYEWTGGPPRKD